MTDEKKTAQPSVHKDTHATIQELARQLSALLGRRVEIRELYELAVDDLADTPLQELAERLSN